VLGMSAGARWASRFLSSARRSTNGTWAGLGRVPHEQHAYRAKDYPTATLEAPCCSVLLVIVPGSDKIVPTPPSD
jgi:hypothetical protein